ncbi:tRNA (cytidine(34)-2'-O)-methyltransferase [Parvibaculum sp.]|uniref:tRNA (cytidine(34)-2'-O)-methyltransferase n=1 Tax=Parvibaculum sp. TaxID=2024848 RepID=UPI0025D7D10A|nr:tRNA (cytidine(34)-2'-O)-methyltransferase [Parvibaculum sp.]
MTEWRLPATFREQFAIERSLMRLALFEPDIPQNTGTLIRLGACLGVPVDIIEPTGFPWGDRALKRAGLDYWELADVTRHVSWEVYLAAHPATVCPATARLVLLTTKSAEPYTGFAFRPGDTLLVGRETAGVPPEVHAAANARLTIPMRPPARSLNVAVAAAMVLGEALRQTGPAQTDKSAQAQDGDKA